MKILVQSVKSGDLRQVDVPVPVVGGADVLVATARSVVSPGTERSMRRLASASLVGKAKARPDLVRQVVKKARSEGLVTTAKAVQSRLDDLMPLGYSAVGTVVEVGPHADGIRPGMRVATGGAGHGEYQVVSNMLAVPVPDDVSDENAAFATVSAIAMHGLRLAELGPGSRVAVIGLGLVGQITCRLARASGYFAYGIDLRDFAVEAAKSSGFDAETDVGDDTTRRVRDWAKGAGVDAVLITAATASSGPIQRSMELVRDRAPIVVVGDVGLELDRRPMYEHELSVRVARSYGPGRYERSYEDWGIDYPLGYVRWTEGRNLESVLDLMADGRLDLSDLITHRFPFTQAEQAYEMLESVTDSFGIQFEYEQTLDPIVRSAQPIAKRSSRLPSRPGKKAGTRNIGIVGAGGFVKSTLMPAVEASNFGSVKAICSATGVSARFLAERHGISEIHTDVDELLKSDIDTVLIATPHSTHAELAVKALEAGKDVFCEKPLCLTLDELDMIEKAVVSSGRYLQVGYNRRHSPAVVEALKTLRGSGPLVVNYRVNAGELPSTHWYSDRREGGRLLGEVCHFIDLVCAFAGDIEPLRLDAFGSGVGPAELDQDVVVSMAFPNGTVGTISYASHGHPSMPKERIDIVGRGHSVTIDDFSSLHIDGKEEKGVSGKGHANQFAAFNTGGELIGGLLASRLSIEAVNKLSNAGVQQPL